MSIGMPSENGMTVRSPTSKQRDGSSTMEDVELGGSSNTRRLKAKESDLAEISREDSAAEGGSAMKSLVASAMYSGCSVGMVMVNKSLASR